MLRSIPAASGLILLAGGAAEAGPRSVQFKKASETRDVGNLDAGDLPLVTALISKKGSPVSNVPTFKAKTTALAINTAWVVDDASGFRLVGVNVDLIDGNGVVVASDAFLGLTGRFAISELFFTSLNPGGPTDQADGHRHRHRGLRACRRSRPRVVTTARRRPFPCSRQPLRLTQGLTAQR